MYVNQEIKTLRKSGQLASALKLGQKALASSPNDLWLKREVAWVYYEYIKRSVLGLAALLEKNQKLDAGSIKQLHEFCKEYARLKLARPDMAFSNINFQLAKVGRHLDFYVPFLKWAGIESFSSDDHAPYQAEQGVSPSKVTKVAREAAAWCNSQQRAKDHGAFILNLMCYALDNRQEDASQRIWLLYDRAELHLRLKNIDEAASDMREVLRLKGKEFWAWNRMAEIQQQRSPQLAVASLCQAMLCRPDPKFTGRLHIRLGQLLQEQHQIDIAVAEYLAAADIYTKECWPFPEELDGALQASWFDPSQAIEDRIGYYKAHAEPALNLLYDSIRETRATFLTEIGAKSGGRKKALVSVLENAGTARQILAPGTGLQLSAIPPGTPLTLMMGVNGTRTDILGVERRKAGTDWDCLNIESGIVSGINKEGTRGGVFIRRNLHAILMSLPSGRDQLLKVGDPVRVALAQNPAKENRWEAWPVQRLNSLPNLPDVEEREGEFKLHPKGFAFVDDIFVPPTLVDPTLDQKRVIALCVQDFNKTKGSYGWKAIRVSALDDKAQELVK